MIPNCIGTTFAATFLVLCSCCTTNETSSTQPATKPETMYEPHEASLNILEWPRMKSTEFGCLLEKKFGHRDPQFNCQSEEPKNLGDPCKDTIAYYAGPVFPHAQANKVHKTVRDITVAWEHGEMQAVTLLFIEKIPEKEIQRIFSLPTGTASERKNISSISIQDCHNSYNCLVIQGFDHLGAGDVECPEGTKGPRQ